MAGDGSARHHTGPTTTAPWISYRPEVKVLDCTVRDGGLVNDHRFTDDFVRAVYKTCLDAGIDMMEIGYLGSPRVFEPSKFGPWKFCEEDDLRRVLGDNDTPLKIAAMADAGGKCDWQTQIRPKSDSVLDVIRVACYVSQINEAVEMIEHAANQGYEVFCNIMAVSTVQDAELEVALEVAGKSPASTVVVVDSFGSLNPVQVELLVKKYQEACEGKEIGIHAHNNQQLAFANTIEAIINGATRVDATMAGMGRGAGNCPMELLLGLLRNPKFHIRPVWKLLQEHMAPLQRELDWGPSAPYMITGQLNQHPRSAIGWRDQENRDDVLDFYDSLS